MHNRNVDQDLGDDKSKETNLILNFLNKNWKHFKIIIIKYQRENYKDFLLIYKFILH